MITAAWDERVNWSNASCGADGVSAVTAGILSTKEVTRCLPRLVSVLVGPL
jgi:hypothetical protein